MTNEELIEALGSVKFKFWACPIHPESLVEWIEETPVCKECCNNKEFTPNKQNAASAPAHHPRPIATADALSSVFPIRQRQE